MDFIDVLWNYFENKIKKNINQEISIMQFSTQIKENLLGLCGKQNHKLSSSNPILKVISKVKLYLCFYRLRMH